MSLTTQDKRDIKTIVGEVLEEKGIVGTLDEHSSALKQHASVLDQHTITLDQHTITLDQHTTILDQHTSILDQHTTILDQHTTILDQHTTILHEHSNTLHEHGVLMEDTNDMVRKMLGMLSNDVKTDVVVKDHDTRISSLEANDLMVRSTLQLHSKKLKNFPS